MPTSSSSRGRLAAVLAAVLFGIGYVLFALVPGGGDVEAADFEEFYVTDERTGVALLLFLALIIGSHLLVWFFSELKTALPDTVLGGVAYRLSLVATSLVIGGGALIAAPSAAQVFSDAAFVGAPVAHTVAQAGLMMALLGGIYGFAVVTFLFSLAARRAGLLPAWLAVGGMVVAVLMLGSFVWLPGYLFVAWVLLVGIVGWSSRSDGVPAA